MLMSCSLALSNIKKILRISKSLTAEIEVVVGDSIVVVFAFLVDLRAVGEALEEVGAGPLGVVAGSEAAGDLVAEAGWGRIYCGWN